MGWFSSFCSSVSSAVSSVASSVGSAVASVGRGIANVAGKVWDTAKDVASKAVTWVADKAEDFIGKVKDIWAIAKPWVEKITPWIDAAADFIPWPWLRVAVKAVAKGLEHLLRLDKSPVLQKLEKAIKWAIEIARHLRTTFLTKEGEVEAEQRQKDLQEAYDLMQTEEQRQSVRFAMLINDYILVQTRIQAVLDKNAVKDFEHYLRLRATQKLLKSAEKTLSKSERMEDIKDDDVFLMKVGSDLLAEVPTLSDEDATRLDKLIKRRFNGKSLIPFVFEEMICAWETRYQNMEAQWNKMNKEFASLKRQAKELEIKMSIEPLTKEEQEKLIEFKQDILTVNNQLKVQAEDNRAMQSYVHAAEGFLQVLEKTPEQFVEEGREFVLYDVETVGMLIINCAQNDVKWEDLTEEQQSLITDYANIFAEDSKARKEAMLEVEVV